jgi:hypothetical protein
MERGHLGWSARIQLGLPAVGSQAKSKGESMKSKAVKSRIMFMVLIVIIMVWALGVNAGAQPSGGGQPAGGSLPAGSPPSGGTAAQVKKDNTPIPKSGVLSITFLGNKKFTNEQLQKVIAGTELKLGGKVGPAVIGPAMTALVDFYHKNGANLNASPNIIEDSKGITFVQFIIDENGKKGDIGGLVSSGGPHIFCESEETATAAGGKAAPGGAGAPPGGGAPGGGAAEAKKDNTPIPSSGLLSITFLGNKKFTSEQLQKVVDGTQLKLGGPVNFSVIAPAMKALVNFYKENKTDFNISPNIIDDPKGITFVQFIIDENGKKGDIGGLVSSGGPQIFCN